MTQSSDPRTTGFDIMVRILAILDRILEEIRRENPYGLILKGGTALALHHLNEHRESEDLDFDVGSEFAGSVKAIASYMTDILDGLVEKGFLKNYTVRKQSMTTTNRYHMNITMVTYKRFFTKIDLDFVELPDNMEYEGKLGFYSMERMFVDKLLTFKSRKELKDLYDISHLIQNLKANSFIKPEKLALLIENNLIALDDDTLTISFKKTLGKLDLRFKNLREANVESFTRKAQRDLRIFRNELLKGK